MHKDECEILAKKYNVNLIWSPKNDERICVLVSPKTEARINIRRNAQFKDIAKYCEQFFGY